MCGETFLWSLWLSLFPGLSPRVRGNPLARLPRSYTERSIPACAGKPGSWWPASHPRTVYPRVCGETRLHLTGARATPGLSPRVRGNRRDLRTGHGDRRSIPACAGKPPSSTSPPASLSVYPRVCGETAGSLNVYRAAYGLSPRVRGNRNRSRAFGGGNGSIPACAGKPLSWLSVRVCSTVYPRVCGETTLGFLPALCGKVYPRVCGETFCSSLAIWASAGLSPRVRGNPYADMIDMLLAGSIPACAGKPMDWRS